MIRATTPTHEFVFQSDPAAYKKILITYKQGVGKVLEINKEDLTIDSANHKATYKLTQEQTKMFNAVLNVRVQVRILDADGNAFASSVFSVNVTEVLNDEVLTDEI